MLLPVACRVNVRGSGFGREGHDRLGNLRRMAFEKLGKKSGGFLRAGLATHGGRSSGETLTHAGIGKDVLEIASKFVVGPIVAMHLEAVAGFVDAGGVIVAVPNIRHDDGRLGEVETFREGVVASVVNDGIDLRDDRRLGEPVFENDVFRNVRIGFEITAYIHQDANGKPAKSIDKVLKGSCVAAAE